MSEPDSAQATPPVPKLEQPASASYQFRGFYRPTYTPVPDELFDELMPRLSESELKVLLYVIRRTFGFKKDADAISLKQMVEGIMTRDGRQLDRGTGLSRPGVTKGVKGLVEKGVLIATRNSSKERGDQPTTYELRFVEGDATALPGGSKNFYDGGGYDVTSPPRNDFYPQETVNQETERQHVEASTARAKSLVSDEELVRRAVLPYAKDLARELNDQAPLTSTMTRLVNLYQAAGVDLDTFLEHLLTARAITQSRTGSIRSETSDSLGPKPKTAYFLAVLADRLAVSLT